MVPLPSAAIAQAAWKANRSTSQARYTNLHARMPKRKIVRYSWFVIFITDTGCGIRFLRRIAVRSRPSLSFILKPRPQPPMPDVDIAKGAFFWT